MTTTAAQEYVQPIMLLVDKDDPADATDAIRAAATASVSLYLGDLRHDEPDLTVWDEWLAGPFTKTVRRADTKAFEKVLAGFDPSDYILIIVDKARAAAFRPVPATEMPKRLAKLQVSGTELPDRLRSISMLGAPTVVVNGGLGMSTGKAAAQAAHALFLHHLTALPKFVLAECEVHQASGDEFQRLLAAHPDAAVIADAGRTEIEPGSVTAFCVEELIR